MKEMKDQEHQLTMDNIEQTSFGNTFAMTRKTIMSKGIPSKEQTQAIIERV